MWFNRFVLAALLITLIWGQNQESSPYSYARPLVQFPQVASQSNRISVPQQRISLEGAVDSKQYILGPGDILGINMVLAESWSGEIPVSPTGEVLIPGMGILPVSGLTLDAARDSIRSLVLKKYQTALINVTLMNIRTFRLPVLGAVVRPGYVDISPRDRLLDVISLVGGLHKFADSDHIVVERSSGTRQVISLKDYLLTGNEESNPQFLEGDKITVPFIAEVADQADRFITPTATPVSVSGFVNAPGAYQFMYGYTVRDYIGIAGGLTENGSLRTTVLYRNNQAVALNLAQYVEPGDQIFVGENFRSRFLGKSSLMQTITAVTSLYLTYLSRVKK